MKVVAWYLIIFTVIQAIYTTYTLTTSGINPNTLLGTIVPVLLIPVFVMAIWFIRGRTNKVLAWYAVILFIAEVAFLIFALIQGSSPFTFIGVLVLHTPMLFFGIKIIRIK